MWLPKSVIARVDEVATIVYVNRARCALWNENRRGGELRLLTGWCWTARDGRSYRQGFKTETVAYRDAWYALVKHQRAPQIDAPKPALRVVRVA